MRQQENHHLQKIFVAEGEKVVRRLLETHLEIISVLLPDKWLEPYTPLIEARRESIDTFVASKETIQNLINFSVYQGVMAVARVPEPASIESVVESSPAPRLFAAIDKVSGAENVGTVVRNAVALGCQALIVGETSSSPYLRRAVRAAMGTIFKMPHVEPRSLVDTLRYVRSRGVHCVAAHPHTDRKWLWQANLRTDCCIVLGSEGFGISPEVLALCDEQVAIPMEAGVDSLNIGSAAAAFFYEAMRQRRAK